MDVHETAPESLILSFGIADKFARQEKVMEFLLSQSEEFKEKGFDMSLLNELMEFESMKSSSQLRPYDTSSVLYLNQELGKPVLDLVRDMMENPEFSVRSNGHVLFSSSSNPELNDLLSIASEFNLSRNSTTKWRQLSPLIPHFQRFESDVFTPAKLKAVTVLAPLKSPEKSRLKSPRKHNTKRKAKERDLYKRNHLHAYESLLSLMIGNDHRHKHTTVLSLQKSCGELSELLTQFSITAAGTGIAVLFSVVCSLASRRVPFCANKFFDTGLGLSLVILSWAVNRLREVIVHVNRKANKPCSSLKDEFPDVRLNIISKLDQVNQVIGIDLLSQSLLPAIVELAEDRHWRVRLAIIEYVPLLASQLGIGFFDDKLGALCMQWLQDKVYSIREAAANNLKRLAEEFGPEWAMQHLVPQVLDMVNNPHYLHRMMVLRAISLMAPVMGSEITCSKFLPVVVEASKDRVPNIKFNVAKLLQSLIPIVDQSVVDKTIRQCLVDLSEDPDVDVRYFANQALNSIDGSTAAQS